MIGWVGGSKHLHLLSGFSCVSNIDVEQASCADSVNHVFLFLCIMNRPEPFSLMSSMASTSSCFYLPCWNDAMLFIQDRQPCCLHPDPVYLCICTGWVDSLWHCSFYVVLMKIPNRQSNLLQLTLPISHLHSSPWSTKYWFSHVLIFPENVKPILFETIVQHKKTAYSDSVSAKLHPSIHLLSILSWWSVYWQYWTTHPLNSLCLWILKENTKPHETKCM